MKAIRIHRYGGPEVLELDTVAERRPAAGEVLVRISAASINPFDVKQRAGVYEAFYPLKLPAILGVDFAGTVVELGPGVQGWKKGDRVFAIGSETHAELGIARAASLARIPEGLDAIEAAALPVVLTTGSALVTKGVGIRAGQTLLVTGATGNVGRAAVFAAKELGARVIAGVRRKYLGAAESLGADEIVVTDDEAALTEAPMVDAVADVVGGPLGARLLGKIKAGGVFASVVGEPGNREAYPGLKVVSVVVEPDARVLSSLAHSVRAGKLEMPAILTLPLEDAAKGHALVEAGSAGKVVLVNE